MSDQSGGGRIGAVGRIVELIKGLTLTNVLVIILLGLAIGPAYLTWRVINDQALLNLIMSSFSEQSLPGTDCSLRVTSLRGGAPTYYISTNYAYSGNDRWYIGVNTPVEPNPDDARTYCDTLDQVIEHARGNAPIPTFPHSKRLMFQPQQRSQP